MKIGHINDSKHVNMSKVISTLSFFFFMGCQEVIVTPDLLGEWKMVESLVDPGDGSGVYQPVEGNYTLTCYADSTVHFNYAVCFEERGDEIKEGIFSSDSISITNCGFSYGYELSRETLFLYPPCIEPCGLKFIKVAD
jgi:hypothetical protein